MAQICPACNAGNPDSARVCSNCGVALSGDVAASRAAAPGAASTSPAARRAASSGAIAEAARRRAAQQRAAEATAAAAAKSDGARGTARSAVGRALPRSPVRGLSSSLNKSLDRAGLPRFSTQRYLVIWVVFAVVLLLTIGALVWIGASSAQQSAANAHPTPLAGQVLTGTLVTMTTTQGIFQITLDTDPAVKETVRNFRAKVASGYYDGKIFHRVLDWLVQGGAPNCNTNDTRGCNAGGGTIAGEYTQKPFKPWSVGMVAPSDHAAQVNDSQWFVVKTDAPHLVNNEPRFGDVTSGQDVVGKLVGCKPKPDNPNDLDCKGADKIVKATLGTK
ncbi:MAG: peptidylprolyl isomerase [Chloroflexia bacterium]